MGKWTGGRVKQAPLLASPGGPMPLAAGHPGQARHPSPVVFCGGKPLDPCQGCPPPHHCARPLRALALAGVVSRAENIPAKKQGTVPRPHHHMNAKRHMIAGPLAASPVRVDHVSELQSREKN